MGRRVRKSRSAEQSDLPCPGKSRPPSERRRRAQQSPFAGRLPTCTLPGGRYFVPGVCLLLLLAVALVFGQTVRHEFINYDDNEYVYENSLVTGGLTGNAVVAAFSRTYANNWHPLTWLSHVLDWQVYGLQAGGHHLSNVLLHAATAVLLFLVLRRMTAALWPSAFVAAVFAIHPLHVESVAWVAERKDVLSGLLFTLTLAAYLGYVRRPFSLVRYLTVALLFALGLMAKPMLVTLPFVLLLLDYWPLGRMKLEENEQTEIVGGSRSGRFSLLARLLLEKVPLLLVAAGSCAATVWAQQKAMMPGEYLPFFWRIANAVVSYAAYLGQLFYPVGLAVYYPHAGPDLPVWQIAAATCVLLGITAVALVLWRRSAYLLVGWLWYLGMLVPVIGLVQVGVQARADRYTYLTQIGLYAALAWGMAETCRGGRHRRWLCGLGGGLALAALMGCAWRQTSLWRDSETLWRHTLTHTLRNPVAHNNLGNALADRKQPEEAIAEYRKALALRPGYAEAHNNLGNTLAGRGEIEEGIACFRRALEIKPDLAEARNNLGNALAGRGQIAEAIVHYRKALEIKPDHAYVHNNLGNVLTGRGEFDEAIVHYRKALRFRPGFAEAHTNLGAALAGRKETAEAIAEYRKALEIKPDFAEAHANLGIVLAGRGEIEEAIAEYRKALEIKPEFARVHYGLAVALAGRGKVEEAIAEYRRAMELKPDYADAHYGLGNLLASQGKIDEAIRQYLAVLRLNPDDVHAHTQLGNALAKQGNLKGAIVHYRAALRINPSYATASMNLATAYAEAGEFSAAIENAQKALALAEQQKNTALAEALKLRIERYRAGAPFREPAPDDKVTR